MTIKDIKEIFANEYTDIEYYRYQFQNHRSIHTDYIESVDDITENETVEDWLLADQETYSNTVYANAGAKADFTEWYDDAEAKVLIVIIKDEF